MTQSTQRKPEEPITNTNTSGRTIAGPPGYQREVHHLTSPETFGEPAGSSVRGGFFFFDVPHTQAWTLHVQAQDHSRSMLGRPQLSAVTASVS